MSVFDHVWEMVTAQRNPAASKEEARWWYERGGAALSTPADATAVSKFAYARATGATADDWLEQHDAEVREKCAVRGFWACRERGVAAKKAREIRAAIREQEADDERT